MNDIATAEEQSLLVTRNRGRKRLAIGVLTVAPD